MSVNKPIRRRAPGDKTVVPEQKCGLIVLSGLSICLKSSLYELSLDHAHNVNTQGNLYRGRLICWSAPSYRYGDWPKYRLESLVFNSELKQKGFLTTVQSSSQESSCYVMSCQDWWHIKPNPGCTCSYRAASYMSFLDMHWFLYILWKMKKIYSQIQLKSLINNPKNILLLHSRSILNHLVFPFFLFTYSYFTVDETPSVK